MQRIFFLSFFRQECEKIHCSRPGRGFPGDAEIYGTTMITQQYTTIQNDNIRPLDPAFANAWI